MFINQPQRRARMGRAASVFAQQNFFKERLVNEIEQVYVSVLERRNGKQTQTKGETK